MQNNNENKFLRELLSKLQTIEVKRIQEMKVFFSQAFLLHTTDEVFDESEYREEWANLINWMHELSLVTNNYSEKEIEDAISLFLNPERKEVSHA